MSETTEPKTAGRELLLTRIFNAPRALVWKAWTDPKHVMRWWGPKPFTSPACAIDFRVGGKFLFCMRSPEGQDFWTLGVYREIVPNERIVYADYFSDEKGNIVPGSRYGLPGDWPSETIMTLTFEDHAGKTKMTLRHAGIPAGKPGEMIEAGWSTSLEKLAESLL